MKYGEQEASTLFVKSGVLLVQIGADVGAMDAARKIPAKVHESGDRFAQIGVHKSLERCS